MINQTQRPSRQRPLATRRIITVLVTGAATAAAWLAAQSAKPIFRAYVENGHWPTIDTELINIVAKFEQALRDGEELALVTAAALTILASSLILGLL